MGCGSSRQADIECNSVLANHLSDILGIRPGSAVVQRYVTQLRSEGFDTPDDLDTIAVATLETAPFHFKQGHLLKIALSRTEKEPKHKPNYRGHLGQLPTVLRTRSSALADFSNAEVEHADGDRDAFLAAHLSSILSIEPASADVTRYVARLRAEGYDTPEDIDGLTISELVDGPFNFKRLHAKKVAHPRQREVVEAQTRVDVIKTGSKGLSGSIYAISDTQQADDECNAALAAHLSSILRIKPASADVAQYVAQLRAGGYDTPEDMADLTVEELASKPFNFKKMHVKKVRIACTKLHLENICVTLCFEHHGCLCILCNGGRLLAVSVSLGDAIATDAGTRGYHTANEHGCVQSDGCECKIYES